MTVTPVTAYALAELIDNSVQADSSTVELVCREAYRQVNERSRRRIQAIGIVDNGDGMFSGTRLSWRGALATLRNTESLVGRMYRKFIDDGRLSIRLLAVLDGEEDPTFDKPVRVNDPLYLTRNSSTPAPFDTGPMFQSWGDAGQPIMSLCG